MILPTSKLPNVGLTIFSQMSQLAAEHGAINLSQGFPDFLPDEKLLKSIGSYAEKGFDQYSPLAGVLPLRENIAKKIEDSHQSIYDVETEITVTAGATQAIFTAVAAFVKKEDEVIIFEPAYDCYEPAVELFGGTVKRFQMKAPDFKIDWAAVRKLVSEKTKMIIINNPINPTGTLLKENDVQELIQIVKGSNIISTNSIKGIKSKF